MKNKFLFYFLITIAIILQLYPVFKQPLWLDEYFSIYFSSYYSPFKLIFGLPETHPGGYYLLLKILFNLSHNYIFLRITTAVIPQLVGAYIIYKLSHNYYIVLAYLLNPFLIHSGWQLRMYGFSALFTAIFLSISAQKDTQKKIHSLIVFTIFSTLFSFSFVIPLFCLCTYLCLTTKKKIYALIPFISLVEFFTFKGFQNYKKYTELASWIDSPTFRNFGNALITLFGFKADINNVSQLSIVASILVIAVFVAILVKQSNKFHISFTIPLLITTAVSVIFPFLSIHFFFYKFVPKISLFVPRFLLPFAIIFYYFILKKISIKHQPLVLVLLLLFWLEPYYELNYSRFYNLRPEPSSDTISTVIPPWENLSLPQKYQLSDINAMNDRYNNSMSLEYIINSNLDCRHITKYSQVKYINQTAHSLTNYQSNTKKYLNKCCLPISPNEWKCLAKSL